MNTLFNIDKDNQIIAIGENFGIKKISELDFDIYRYGIIDRKVNFKDTFEKRVYICQLTKDYKFTKTSVANGFGISEKTLRNWMSVFETEGIRGLQNSTKEGVGRKPLSSSQPHTPLVERASEINRNKREKEKREKKVQQDLYTQQNLKLDFEASDTIESALYSEEYDWVENRYAGAFLYLNNIEFNHKALSLFQWFLGDNAVIMMLFIVMQAFNIQSIEQLKTVFKKELGKVVGISKLYSFPKLWRKIHDAVETGISLQLKENIFKNLIYKGLVSLWYLFIDGHFVPYTGKEKVHKNFHTQSREMHPGQNEMFIHDMQGRIVYFDIQEGKGDMLKVIKEKSQEYRAYFNNIPPLFVADRELWGVKRFEELSDCRFVTWEKNSSKPELDKLSDKLFNLYIHVNKSDYQLYETNKTYKDGEGNSIVLRRIVIWNTKQNYRSVAVSNDIYESTQTLAIAMLNRWGKSENSFKHMANQFNMHYNPVLEINELSENQSINNPAYINIEKQIGKLKRELTKNEIKIGRKKLVYNKDGKLRINKSRNNLIKSCEDKRLQIKELQEKLNSSSQKIKTVDLPDNKPFKTIATEGKNLWNICETLVWNSRKEMEKILSEFIPNNRDRLPVLDAIIKCNARIKSTEEYIFVQFEALERPAFYQAQIQFVKKMNQKNGTLFNQKKIHFKVESWKKNR